MARLTDKKDWDYQSYTPPPTEHFIGLANDKTGWVHEVRKWIPDHSHFIELGCAPGYCSAAVSHGKSLQMYGVDFSHAANSYLKTLETIGYSKASLFHQDLFDCKIDRDFDVVGSFGLIEHFSEEDLSKLLILHDSLTRNGGRVIIEIPNFNGLQGLWHRFFDHESYKLHNITTMRPSTFDFFLKKGYKLEYCGYVGRLRVWGDSGAYTAGGLKSKFTKILEKLVNTMAANLEKVGINLTGRAFSPALLFIASKPCCKTHDERPNSTS